MEPPKQASEIASVVLARAAEFVEELRPLGRAGFSAVDDAIHLILDASTDDDESRYVRSAAVSGLVAILMEIDIESDE